MIKEDCIFCKIANGEIPCKFVYETDDVVAFDDLNPQAPIHTLIVPKQHFETIEDVNDPELLAKLMLAVKEVAKIKGAKNGFRTVINTKEDGGQEVFHLHIHVLAGRKLKSLG
ncbi:MAG: histidine triad nucleotide-binding protein [Candidatus Gastranaerophilales bacterium]|nr:histidine triad nucleotide-binding protein [Candidatus Gastranaerophilales bacterium]